MNGSPLVSPATRRGLCSLNIGYVNRVACYVECSGNRHLFALIFLRVVGIIEEVPGHFALGRLACDQGILPVLELRNLAGECLVLLLGLLLLFLLGVAATLGSQAGEKAQRVAAKVSASAPP